MRHVLILNPVAGPKNSAKRLLDRAESAFSD